MTPRNVLVTGGAGFIGSHVADAYAARGDRVWVVDDLSSGREANLPRGAEFVRMDIGDAALDELFRSAGGFDLVNHHAAQIDVRRSVADPRADARVNVDGLLNVLECARRQGTRRVIFVSSGGVVYGEADVRPTPETAPKLPLSPYGVTKLVAEYYLYYYRAVHGLEYAALRYANVYGPRQDPHGEAGVVAIFCNRLLAGEPLTVYGDGAQTRDYVYVDDVVAANVLVGETDLANPVAGWYSVLGTRYSDATNLDARAYNVGTGVETSVNQLAATLMEVAGHAAELRYAPERPGELRRSALDASKLGRLGWRPAVSLREGLAKTHAYVKG